MTTSPATPPTQEPDRPVEPAHRATSAELSHPQSRIGPQHRIRPGQDHPQHRDERSGLAAAAQQLYLLAEAAGLGAHDDSSIVTLLSPPPAPDPG